MSCAKAPVVFSNHIVQSHLGVCETSEASIQERPQHGDFNGDSMGLPAIQRDETLLAGAPIHMTSKDQSISH